MNLSREQVARELKLSIDIIIALEEEDYENLGAPIFVTGYIRNYAQILNIPVEPLLAAYSQVKIETPPLVASAVRKPKRQYSSLVIKFVSAAILLIVIAGIVSWFQSQEFNKASDSDKTEITATVKQPQKGETDSLIEEASPKAPLVEPVPGLESEPVTSIASVPQSDSISVVEPLAISTPVTVPENTLSLRLSEDSWVDIRDSTGKRLIYDLLRAGKQRQVSGKPPYKVFLGNAKGVKIEYNGELIDIEKYRKGNLARFTLGEAQE